MTPLDILIHNTSNLTWMEAKEYMNKNCTKKELCSMVDMEYIKDFFGVTDMSKEDIINHILAYELGN